MAYRSMMLIAAAVIAAAALAGTADAKTLKVAPHSDLKIVDPIWTTALISVNHGYMVYDTLFALDGNLNPQPQMVERHQISADKLTWTFTLRDGLEWHDGAPAQPVAFRKGVTGILAGPSIAFWNVEVK